MSEINNVLSLEEAMNRLEEITETMEKETLPLDRMMELFKEGKSLEKKCRELLNLAEKEVEILSAGSDDKETEDQE